MRSWLRADGGSKSLAVFLRCKMSLLADVVEKGLVIFGEQ
jgi:hypothetical protein